MKIETSKGKVHDVESIGQMLRERNRIYINLLDTRTIPEIAGDMDGLSTIRKTDGEAGEHVYEVYEGFSVLIGLQRDKARGVVRVILERGDV